MSADNAWFIYPDGSGLHRIKHGFASHVPELSNAPSRMFDSPRSY